MSVLQFTANSLAEFVEQVCNLNNQLVKNGTDRNEISLFRGQSSVDYELMPALGRNQRHFEENGLQRGIFDEERNLIEMAKYKLPDIFRNDMQPLELLALLQHYGIPTRLLDITENALVALYFACCSEPNKDGEVTPATLVAANEAGATHIYKVGGAQAIGALAYGTESIEKVDKIVGPGNIYVALAKKAVYGHCDIDMLAGPSEILIVADKTADPVYTAADMLSQAEHDMLASSIVLTDDEALADKVSAEVEKQLAKLPRKEIAKASLERNGRIILTENLMQAMELANYSAPEHMEILTENPFSLLPYVRHAGAVFLGAYSPEPLGDYFAGPNHVLPTGGTARYYSVLNTETFMKRTSIISYTQKALQEVSSDIVRLAEAEGLQAHANAIKLRGEKID